MSKSYGLLAVFDKTHAVYNAAEKTTDAGYTNWDVLSPFPIHGIEGAMGLPRSKVPVFTFIGGFSGFWIGMFLAWWMGFIDYPLIVRGMPFFSPIFPFPIAYEMTILLAAFGTLGGMFITNKLPMHHHPVMNAPDFHRFTNDQFGIVIETADPKFDAKGTRAFLEGLTGAKEVIEIQEEAE